GTVNLCDRAFILRLRRARHEARGRCLPEIQPLGSVRREGKNPCPHPSLTSLHFNSLQGLEAQPMGPGPFLAEPALLVDLVFLVVAVEEEPLRLAFGGEDV